MRSNLIGNMLLLGFLAVCALQDVRRQSITVLLLSGGILAGFAWKIFFCRNEPFFWDGISELGLSLIPGFCLLLLSVASSRAMGLGDAWVILVAGIFLGWHSCILFLLITFLLCSICSIFLVLFRRKKWQDRLPFVPFLLAGYIFLLAIP